jgi:hypothetical protein
MPKSKNKKQIDPLWLDRALFVNSQYYTLCTSEAQFHKILKYLNVPKDQWPPFINKGSNATTHYFINDKTRSTVVCMPPNPEMSNAQIVALLCHEAVHIWQATRRDYGERKPSSELEAYAVQSLTQRLVEEYERQTEKKKCKK